MVSYSEPVSEPFWLRAWAAIRWPFRTVVRGYHPTELILQQERDRALARVQELESDLKNARLDLEKSKSTCTVQELEIKQLIAVNARDRERVHAEQQIAALHAAKAERGQQS